MKRIELNLTKKNLFLTFWQKIRKQVYIFLNKINFILDKYAPLKKVSKSKLKFKSKPWITSGIQKSISLKNITI